jgi:transposase
MLKVDQAMDILDLHHQGHSIRAIARMTHVSRNSVRKLLRGQHSLQPPSPRRASKLEPYHDYLTKRFQEYGLSAVRLLAEIRPMGYTGSLATLRRFLGTLRGANRRQEKLTVRFETPPGHQAQADWAYCGRFATADGKPLAIYAFVMVLSYSRQLFVRFTTSMRLPELIACHQEAFQFFGGWTKTILYDNMKQVKLGPGQWNDAFLDFARHYGFVAKTHRPYRPRTKGKVERMVDYVKDNFLAGRVFHGLDDLNVQARRWLDETANVRIHGTTGQRPVDLFTQESLTPWTSVGPYRGTQAVQRTVNWEALVHFQGSRYSVPPANAGQVVEVLAEGGQIVVRTGDTIIAEHRQAAQAGQCVVEKEHLAELWKLTAERTPVPCEPRWQLDLTPSVQHMPLAAFEEVCL